MTEKILEIPLEEIQEHDSVFERCNQDSGIEQLATSIYHHGQLEPVRVTPTSDGYRIVNGNRRFFALKRLGRSTIRAIVCETADLVSAVAPNTHQETFDSLTKLKAVRQLLQEHPHLEGKTMGTILNLETSVACKFMRLARSHPRVLEALEKEPDSVEAISMGVAREIAYQPADAQEHVLEEALERQRKLKRRLMRDEFLMLVKDGRAADPLADALHTLAESFSNATGLEVTVSCTKSKAKHQSVTFGLSSEKDKEAFLNCLGKYTTAIQEIEKD